MSSLQFPVQLTFKVSTFANDFTATDANGQTIAYVRQKLFKLKEDIQIFTDESKSQLLYTIKADKWLDFSTAYSFTKSNGDDLGKIARKGWASLWKAKYEIIDQNNQLQYHVREHNAWTKVLDSLMGEIPFIGIFTGYLFNPSYNITNTSDELMLKLKKKPSFLGKSFEISKIKDIDSDDGERVMLGLMMMVLLERRRG